MCGFSRWEDRYPNELTYSLFRHQYYSHFGDRASHEYPRGIGVCLSFSRPSGVGFDGMGFLKSVALEDNLDPYPIRWRRWILPKTWKNSSLLPLRNQWQGRMQTSNGYVFLFSHHILYHLSAVISCAVQWKKWEYCLCRQHTYSLDASWWTTLSSFD